MARRRAEHLHPLCEPLNGRMIRCQECSSKLTETMADDIAALIDPA